MIIYKKTTTKNKKENRFYLWIKKPLNGNTNYDWLTWNVCHRLGKGAVWKGWKSGHNTKPSKLQYYCDRPDYWKESWRPAQTSCHSDICVKPSVNLGWKCIKKINNDYRKLKGGINSWRSNASIVKNPKRHFHRNLPSPLLFVVDMMPLSHIIKKYTRSTNSPKHRKTLIISCMWIT